MDEPLPLRVQNLRCPFCHDSLQGFRITCNGCRACYHADCWRQLGGCATLGCEFMGAGIPRATVTARPTGSGPFGLRPPPTAATPPPATPRVRSRTFATIPDAAQFMSSLHPVCLISISSFPLVNSVQEEHRVWYWEQLGLARDPLLQRAVRHRIFRPTFGVTAVVRSAQEFACAQAPLQLIGITGSPSSRLIVWYWLIEAAPPAGLRSPPRPEQAFNQGPWSR